jgi:hypothetical protein
MLGGVSTSLSGRALDVGGTTAGAGASQDTCAVVGWGVVKGAAKLLLAGEWWQSAGW